MALQQPTPPHISPRIAEDQNEVIARAEAIGLLFLIRRRVGPEARDLLRAIDVVEANDAGSLLITLARQRRAQELMHAQQRLAIEVA